MGRIGTLEEIVSAVHEARADGAKITLTNGAFDLLHVGHVRSLRAAADLGDILVVAINSDASVRRAKGEGRPKVPQQERAEIVSAIDGVSWVTVFDSDTVEPVIRALKPDYHAKGSDYSPDSVPEAPVVRECGGEVVIVGGPKEHSTSELLQRLENGK